MSYREVGKKSKEFETEAKEHLQSGPARRMRNFQRTWT